MKKQELQKTEVRAACNEQTLESASSFLLPIGLWLSRDNFLAARRTQPALAQNLYLEREISVGYKPQEKTNVAGRALC
jgi:hypothetical protein